MEFSFSEDQNELRRAARRFLDVASSGVSLFMVLPEMAGLTRTWLPTLDQTRRQASIELNDVVVSTDGLLGDEGQSWQVCERTIDLAMIALAAEQVGTAEACLDMSVEYAKVRRQFGRAIGSFQAIKHKCAKSNALRMLEHQSTDLNREALISKLYWSNWHRDLGKLAMDLMGPEGEMLEEGPYELTRLQKWVLFSRADTIYAGSNQVQRNIIGERGLGLPKEPR